MAGGLKDDITYTGILPATGVTPKPGTKVYSRCNNQSPLGYDGGVSPGVCVKVLFPNFFFRKIKQNRERIN